MFRVMKLIETSRELMFSTIKFYSCIYFFHSSLVILICIYFWIVYCFQILFIYCCVFLYTKKCLDCSIVYVEPTLIVIVYSLLILISVLNCFFFSLWELVLCFQLLCLYYLQVWDLSSYYLVMIYAHVVFYIFLALFFPAEMLKWVGEGKHCYLSLILVWTALSDVCFIL